MTAPLAPEERAAFAAVSHRIIPEDEHGPGAGTMCAARGALHALEGERALLRTLVLEGAFGDPAHGGNADGAGWRLLGYPGPRHVVPARDQEIRPL